MRERSRALRRFRRNPGSLVGLGLVAAVLTVALLGPWVAPHDPATIHEGLLSPADGTPVAKAPGHWLGADLIGRDLLSRLLHGGRTSLGVALAAAVVAVALGLGVGLAAGWLGGALDALAMRGVDVLLSLPFLLVAITLHRAVDRPGPIALALLLGALSWTTLARVVRAKTLEVRALPFVEASRLLGSTPWNTLRQHVLPNVLGPVAILATTLVARLVLFESAMSFLGLGVAPPAASWGAMVQEAQDMIGHAPRLVAWPGGLIVLTVFGFNLVGEGLRDALDPR